MLTGAWKCDGMTNSRPQTTITPDDVEQRFQGNICRCTGYRSILKAMHTVAKAAQEVGGGGNVEARAVGPSKATAARRTLIRDDQTAWFNPTSLVSTHNPPPPPPPAPRAIELRRVFMGRELVGRPVVSRAACDESYSAIVIRRLERVR